MKTAPTRIWLVDDDEEDQLLMQAAFSRVAPHLAIHTLDDGEDLLAQLHQNPQTPDLVLLDLNMLRMDGLEALRQLRALGQFNQLPVVILTTSSSMVDRQRATTLGANDYYTKPASFDALAQLADQLTGRWLSQPVPANDTISATRKTITHRYNVTISGQGKQPMLLAHGFGCDQGMWRYIIPAFETDYRVIRFDYIGHGRTSLDAYNRERYSSLHGYAQDLLDICGALDLNDVILVGHSVSSMIGLLACLQQPGRFNQLVMVGPSPRYINDEAYIGGFEQADIDELLATMESNFFGWATSLAPAIMGNPDQPELSQLLTDSFCNTDLEVALQFARVTFLSDNRTDLPKLQTPTLVIQSLDDIIAPVEVGQYVASRIPNGTLEVISATGHCPHISAPAETVRAIRHYLSRPSGAVRSNV